MKQLYIVGKNKDKTSDSWEFQGVFSTEKKALEACKNHNLYFIGPAILNETLPEYTVDWVDAYYPSERQ